MRLGALGSRLVRYAPGSSAKALNDDDGRDAAGGGPEEPGPREADEPRAPRAASTTRHSGGKCTEHSGTEWNKAAHTRPRAG